ncbi:hypothetical protein FHX82_001503 [Amycolatopsis bartoniae]|nr:hypothetical protein [Amycolatopsis bartoniae]
MSPGRRVGFGLVAETIGKGEAPARTVRAIEARG